MATWQQGINSGGFLAGIGAQNENAPKASDINATLGLIRENNELARSGANNVALTGLRGLAGVADIYNQEQQQKALNAFNQVHANAWATGDNSGLIKFAQENPAFVTQAQQAFSGLNEQQRNDMGDLAMKANVALSQGPEAYSKFITDNKDRLNRVGANPDWMIQTGVQNPEQLSHMLTTMTLGAVGPDKMLDYQDKMAGREIDRGRLAETIRSNQAGEALQAKGQNLSYQSAMTGHGLAAERLALDKQKFGFEVQLAQKKADELINAAPKLSVNMEKAIEKSAGDAAASRNAADSMTTLADTLEKEKPTPGLFGNAENMFSKLTGQDNYLRDMRIRFNQLANAQATKLLPPGPASDKDIEFARKGIPSETDNPMVMARWLRGMAKMESNNAKFNEFRSEWMSANGSPGQSDRNRNIMGMDVKKGESLNSAAKRFLSSNYGDSQPQQQLSDDELISKYLGGQ
ncbi:acyltransferase [Salmonella enterica subsp. enterica serovar Nottingham]|nr:acyltransferase [Salmonella enterica subsp. enterica serovar Nottingham]EJX8680525.1 DNA transfer protein [Salmonella enterica]ECB1785185.1 acyltransferase [Salmonella enterica subsp. enterica serovar Nottingham]EDX6894139.1 acyltransferase [Salmonella enterica subsp. enterica serovar Nottingham]EHG5810568.1 acyltransferase [Salmonella enterica subsp. enterica serovar Nottingham]